jgi:diguanylate cyclase (GGDEF)-like protein/PAS domain S-box-containing protein
VTRSGPVFRPFAPRGSATIGAILVMFGLFSALSVTLSIRAASRSQHKAAVVEVAARQRTLAERYVKEVLLVHDGAEADPATTARLLSESARALLEGGSIRAVAGDDDGTTLPREGDSEVRAELMQERRLVADLTRTGSAYLVGTSPTGLSASADEHMTGLAPVRRLDVLAALTSNVSLNAARRIADNADQNVSSLIVLEMILGSTGLLVSLLLALGLVAAARRQTAHFRSLVTRSTDLVLVVGAGGCRYASDSVADMVGKPAEAVLGAAFLDYVHPDDRAAVESAGVDADLRELVFRVVNRFGEWRHVEARVSDLRDDRHVRGVVLNGRDVTERIRLEEELTRRAFHDDLTELANRALFRERLDRALVRSDRSRESFAVLLVDLDDFKQVNDSLGHDVGDQLLRVVADRFGAGAREGDTLARLGGDEFALLAEEVEEQLAVRLGHRLLQSLERPFSVAGRELTLTGSVGVVVHPGGPGSSDELMRHADVAMYAAKEAGHGRLEVFRRDMARDLGEMLGLEHDLRLGLLRSEFDLHYQPEVDVVTRRIVGVEALLRWRSPTRGWVAPGQFVHVAEATGVIVPLGDFVLHEACWQTSRWLREGLLPEGFVTWVNLSVKQLTDGDVVTSVRRALDRTGLGPERLGLEVTETAIAANDAAGDRARSELARLHDEGLKIAIDDFGTGFSSFGHLRQFPVDMLKIDRSFVQGVDHDAKDAAITGNLANLAHSLELVALAEGIETEEQLAAVSTLGCDLAQGFLFSGPLPAVELVPLLGEGEGTDRDLRASA